MNCTFCGSGVWDVAEGPAGVAICEVCSTRADMTAGAPDRPSAVCSFCNKKERRSRFAFRRRWIVLTEIARGAQICSACVKVAREVILQQRRRRAAGA